MRYFVYLFIFSFWVTYGCQKHAVQTPIKHYPPTTTDTINIIILSSFNLIGKYDTTTRNHINEYIFGRASQLPDSPVIEKKLAGFFTFDKGSYRVSYLPEIRLLHLDSIKKRTPSTTYYIMNQALSGKQLFEVYFIDTNLIYKRFIAAERLKIMVNYNDDSTTSTEVITSVFSHFLKPEVTSRFAYMFN